MKVTLLSLALLGSSVLVPVSDRVPEMNVEALCQATTAIDNSMGLSTPQSLSDCMRDETAAQQQLRTLWPTSAVPLRDSCEGEASSSGIQSYVDLLTCIQMTDLANSMSDMPKLRGASKNRNKQ